ncbi:MAG: ribonuclease Y [Candidatus Campbellbacteria bacterium]|nr:ribonuclease Y [Candidatus Campbellbacteria bacterium]
MVNNELLLLYVAFALVVGIAVGYFLRLLISLGKRGSMELEVKQILLEAREEAKNITADAQKKADEIRERAETEAENTDEKRKTTEDRLIKKEELLDKRQLSLDSEESRLKEKQSELDSYSNETKELEERLRQELASISNMDEKEAREEIFKVIKHDYEEDLMHRLKKLDISGEERMQQKAKEVLVSSIHRLGNSVASEIMSTSVSIDSEDIKGKIIGKEGRNIRTFEKAAGVELIIDDTPGAILISSFDPIRRQIARVALENLILDGRVQPTRIEEEIEKAQAEVNQIIREKGEEAVYECSIYNLDNRITSILGRLYFRSSYGQNVLRHSIEVSHLAGMIAEEVGADVLVAKTAGLVHDIGKAVDHEVQGSHVEIGKRILEKFGAKPEIIKAMQAHHEEYPYETLEAKIVQVADSISASRPGARRDSVENYLKRLSELEDMALTFDGIDRAYALQAGREIRVFVTPENISDIDAVELAKNLARKIEGELRYPGEIKVNVIRESRTIEYAR